MTRLTSEMFVAALMRTAASQDCSAMLLRRGADQAGAIFISVLNDDRKCDLYAPAPQMMASAENDDRKFECRLRSVAEAEINTALGSEQRFDSDIFVVELSGRAEQIFNILRPHIVVDLPD